MHALRHLAAYLDAAGQLDRLQRLVLADREWMDRKFEALEDDGAFLGDLEIVLRRFADPLAPADLLVVAQLFAARFVVHLRGETSAVEELIVLVMEGHTQAALARARLRVAPEKRCGDLLAIHRVLRHRGQIDRDLLNEILGRVFAVEVDRERAYAFAALGEEMALSGFRDSALEAFERSVEVISLMVPDLLDRIWALQALATSRARSGFFADALDTVRFINHPFYAALTIAEMASSAPERDTAIYWLMKAEMLAFHLRDTGQEILILQTVLLGFVSLGSETETGRIMEKLRGFSATSESGRAVRALAIGLAEMGCCQEAEIAMNDLRQEWARGEAQEAIAVAWAKRKQWARAIRVADEIADPTDQRSALRRLAVLAAEAGEERKAWGCLDKARSLPEKSTREPPFSLSTMNTGPLAAQVHSQTQAPSAEARNQALAQEAIRLISSGEEAAARLLVQEIEDKTRPVTTFSDVAIWQTLALAYFQLGESARARDILSDLAQKTRLPILDNLSRREEARRGARIAAECGAFMLAFEMLEALPSNFFSSELDGCLQACEKLSPGLAIAVKAEMARILDWNRPLGASI